MSGIDGIIARTEAGEAGTASGITGETPRSVTRDWAPGGGEIAAGAAHYR